MRRPPKRSGSRAPQHPLGRQSRCPSTASSHTVVGHFVVVRRLAQCMFGASRSSTQLVSTMTR
eukprot:15462099-Alexandrium_andersonii.AAC.1